MHMDVDAFFASVEQGFNPRLRGRPVIVGGYPHEKGCVHTASYEARRRGIKTGMALRTAKRMCPDAVFLKGDFRQYKAAGQTIRKILGRFSPLIEQTSLDDAYIDLTGTHRRFGEPVLVAREIKKAVYEELGITVSVGIAASRLVARIASGLQKPDGLTVVSPGTEREFLSGLPARELLGVGHRTARTLEDLGITTIGGVAALPKNLLIQFFGANGEKIWRFAQGEDNRKVEERKLAKQISRETSFSESTQDDRLIRGTILYLMERIAGKLRENGWTARTVRLRVRYGNGTDDARSHSMHFPTDDTGVLSRQVLELHGKLPRRRAAVSFVSLAVSEIDWKQTGQTMQTRQTCLLFDIEPEPAEMLNRGVDTIRRQFGFSAVGAASTLELKSHYKMEKHGYILRTPSLSQ